MLNNGFCSAKDIDAPADGCILHFFSLSAGGFIQRRRHVPPYSPDPIQEPASAEPSDSSMVLMKARQSRRIATHICGWLRALSRAVVFHRMSVMARVKEVMSINLGDGRGRSATANRQTR